MNFEKIYEKCFVDLYKPLNPIVDGLSVKPVVGNVLVEKFQKGKHPRFNQPFFGRMLG
jgi:hypothetical protein